MQLQVFFTKGMVLKKVMKHADNCVGSLACVELLIYEVVDLTWNSLTTDSKNATFSGCFEVDWTRLERVVGVVDLLGVIE